MYAARRAPFVRMVPGARRVGACAAALHRSARWPAHRRGAMSRNDRQDPQPGSDAEGAADDRTQLRADAEVLLRPASRSRALGDISVHRCSRPGPGRPSRAWRRGRLLGGRGLRPDAHRAGAAAHPLIRKESMQEVSRSTPRTRGCPGALLGYRGQGVVASRKISSAGLARPRRPGLQPVRAGRRSCPRHEGGAVVGKVFTNVSWLMGWRG